MKKIVSLLFIAIMSLNAATVNGGTNDPRLFGKIFFDYTIAGQKYFEYILVGNRKYMVIDNRVAKQIKDSKPEVYFTISGRVEIPEHIEDNSIMVKLVVTEVDTKEWAYMYINDKKITAKQTVFKVQTDSNGNRFLKFNIRGSTRHEYLSKFTKNLPLFTLSIAPATKKRGQDYQWETPRLYVIDE